MRLINLFLVLVVPFISFAQGPSPVSWSFNVEKVGIDEYDLVFTADIEKNWTVYSQFIEEGGPVPTTITYESDGLKTIGESSESGYRKEGMDAIFEMNVIKFLDKEPYIIKQKVKKEGLGDISGYLTFMTCDDERCLPPTDIDFSFDLSKAVMSVPEKEDRAVIEKAGIEEKTEIKSTAVVAETVTPQETDVPVTDKKKTSNEPAKQKQIQAVAKKDASINTAKEISNGPISWYDVPKENRPIAWSYGFQQLDESTYQLLFKAKLDKGWNVYSQFIEEGGPVPTEIIYDSKEGIQLLGTSQENGSKKEGIDAIFEMNVIKYLADQPFSINQKIKVIDDSKPLNGFLTYMVCDEEKCLPPTDMDFFYDLASGTVGPTQKEEIALSGAIITGNTIDQVRPSLKETNEAPLANCGEQATSNSSMFLMFFFGFVGGLLALLTPCVFPMIPLTVSFFTKDTKRKGWMNGLIYGASIIVIYVGIGLLITAFFGTEALNALSTNWIANTLFFLIFVFFAFSFFGFYEITLPSSWSTKSDSMADKGGLLGIFFMAFTLALVSFSCTGPIIGAALVESASNKVGPFVVMLGFSIALALPFGLFAAFPSWLNSLPKSGGWMNSVKVVLGFIELALAFKFLTVADLTSHWGILKYETFMAIWVIIALAMAAYGMGWIKFPHDSPVKKISPRRWAFTILSLAFAGYLMTGFMKNEQTDSYRSLSLLSGLAPPVSYNMFLGKPKVDKSIKDKYPSFDKCANNIDCFKDYFEGLAYAKEVGKPLFVDHTGHGCVNCRKTEDNIWSDERIRKMLNEDFVLVSLYVDDREKLEEMLISKSTSKKLRTIGSRWADFEIANFNQFSQPLYVMVTPQEEVVTIPRGYKEGVEEYYNYLKCGLESFKAVSVLY